MVKVAAKHMRKYYQHINSQKTWILRDTQKRNMKKASSKFGQLGWTDGGITGEAK